MVWTHLVPRARLRPAVRDELSKLELEPEVFDFSEFVSVCVRNMSSRLHIATPLSIHLV